MKRNIALFDFYFYFILYKATWLIDKYSWSLDYKSSYLWSSRQV